MSFIDKAKEMLGEHKDQVEDAVDKIGDLVDDKTHGKYASQVDNAQEKAKDFLDKSTPDR